MSFKKYLTPENVLSTAAEVTAGVGAYAVTSALLKEVEFAEEYYIEEIEEYVPGIPKTKLHKTIDQMLSVYSGASAALATHVFARPRINKFVADRRERNRVKEEEKETESELK